MATMNFKIVKAEGKALKSVMKSLGVFGPFACLGCHNREGLVSTYFLLDREPKTREDDDSLKKQLQREFNINDYGVFSTGRRVIITTARCPTCNSQAIFWDHMP